MKDPNARAAMRARRERAILRREALLETARRLYNRARLAGYTGVPGPGSYRTVYVMRPATMDFLHRDIGAFHEDSPPLLMGDTPKLDNVPVLFSEDLEPDQIILAYEGWPYTGKADLEARADAEEAFDRELEERLRSIE